MLSWVLWKWSRTGDLTRSTFRTVAIGQDLNSPLWSPDGKAIAYVRKEAGAPAQIWIRYLASPVPVRITNEPDGASLVGWSPDSLSVYYCPDRVNEAPLLAASVAGGQPAQVGTVPGWIYAKTMRPDGNAVALMECPLYRCTVAVSSPLGSAFHEYPHVPFAGRTAVNQADLKWSPDGSKLLVSITPASLRTQFWELPWPPGPPKQVLQQVVATASTTHFGWMPDSRHIAYEILQGGLNFHLWIADTASSENRQITGGTTSERFPAPSPDGTRIAYADVFSDMTPVTISLEQGTVRDTPELTRRDSMSAWAARTNVLAWVSMRNGGPEVWLRTADGSERVVATASVFPGEPTRYFMNPAPSPDGSRIAFLRVPKPGAAKYWVISLAGGRPVRVTNTGPDVDELSGAWSPDGTQLALGTAGGLMVAGSGGHASPVGIGPVDFYVPDWSPDGRWITVRYRGEWSLVSPDGQRKLSLARMETASLGFSKDSRRVYGIRTDKGAPVLFYIELANPDKVHDVREIDPVLTPGSPLNPGVRFSVAPDGKSAVFGTYRRHTTLRVLEHFEPPSLLERLGLRAPPDRADLQ